MEFCCEMDYGDIRRDRRTNVTRRLTMALERYDRHMPFHMGTVPQPEGYEITPLEVAVGDTLGRRDGIDRHGRMYNDLEFDIGEFSLASYIMLKARGEPFTATPIFPRRLFSQNHMFVNVDSGIEEPRDLVGKKVGIWSFQTTLCVLAKGDLKLAYDVPWEKIHWIRQHNEELPWTPPDGLSIQDVPKGKDVPQMLVDGEIDAFFHPLPPPAVLARTDRVQRLFTDPKREATSHFHENGFFPIMHLLVFHQSLIDAEPELPLKLISYWEEAKRQATLYYQDPGFSELVFARNEFEAQGEIMALDLWPSGLEANRKNLEQFIEYVADQKLIDKAIPVESLFHHSVLNT